MQWQMYYDEKEKIVYTKTTGVLNISDASVMRDEGIALIRKHGCLLVLLDHSELVGDALTTMDIYDLPKMYRALGVPRELRMALVVPARFMDNLKFYETVCHNNGYSISVFFDRAAALEWLGK